MNNQGNQARSSGIAGLMWVIFIVIILVTAIIQHYPNWARQEFSVLNGHYLMFFGLLLIAFRAVLMK